MYLPRHSMIGVWEGMKLLAVKTFRPLPRSDTLHLMGFNLLFEKQQKRTKILRIMDVWLLMSANVEKKTTEKVGSSLYRIQTSNWV